jgi:hypothetical protein
VAFWRGVVRSFKFWGAFGDKFIRDRLEVAQSSWLLLVAKQFHDSFSVGFIHHYRRHGVTVSLIVSTAIGTGLPTGRTASGGNLFSITEQLHFSNLKFEKLRQMVLRLWAWDTERDMTVAKSMKWVSQFEHCVCRHVEELHENESNPAIWGVSQRQQNHDQGMLVDAKLQFCFRSLVWRGCYYMRCD